MSTCLLLLRHGQIRANVKRRWHGSTDSPLNWRGRRQAKRTRRHLREHITVDALYSSPLQRCQRTATLATKHLQLELEVVEDLREMSIGQWEDMPFRELVDRHNFLHRINSDVHHAAPEGESLAQVATRVTAALHQIDAQHGDAETVLVVGHGVAFGVALATFLHDDPTRWTDYHLDNCSFTHVEFRPEPVVLSYNECTHL